MESRHVYGLAAPDSYAYTSMESSYGSTVLTCEYRPGRPFYVVSLKTFRVTHGLPQEFVGFGPLFDQLRKLA